MNIKYLCLDDEVDKVKPIIELLETTNSGISIEVRSPKIFDSEVAQLRKENIQGLLLDLRLDRVPDESGQRVNYRALSLAQELRTRMTEGEFSSFPIVLWSVDQNFRVSYDKDETGHDLFDAQYFKGAVGEGDKDIAEEMIDLAKGYGIIRTFKSRTVKDIYSKLIDLEAAQDILDPRILADTNNDRHFPAHIFARSIFRNLLLAPGPLIDEKLLAARLGIDISGSADWNRLIEKFASNAKYTGIFCNAWGRWWMFKVDEKWAQICPDKSLQHLNAVNRVEILKRQFRLKDLVPIQPMKEGYSSNFWYVCKISGAPLAAMDAVQLFADRKEWQDPMYCSLDSILERKHREEGYRIHPFEQHRIQELVKTLQNVEEN